MVDAMLKLPDIKILHIDLETGGLDCKTDGIVQIAATMEINGVVTGRFSSFINPPSSLVVSDEALAISKISRETIASAPSEAEVLTMFTSWLGDSVSKFDKTDKALMSGFNVGFDDQFIREWCNRCGEKYLGSYKWADLYDTRGVSALYCLPYRHLLPNFQLLTVANFLLKKTAETRSIESLIASRLGIEAGEAHDARIDVEMTRMIFGIVQNGGKLPHDNTTEHFVGEYVARAKRETERVQNELR